MTSLNFASLPLSKTPNQLFEFIRRIKSRDMRSNSQWNILSLTEKYNMNSIWIGIQNDVSIILFLDSDGIVRLSYYGKSANNLFQIKEMVPNVEAPIMCDLLGKEPVVSEYAEELKTIFKPYTQYKRMVCTELDFDKSIDVSDVELAESCDETEILEMLHGEFDVLTARMPRPELVRERINNKDILLVRKDNKIAGFINFDSRGKKAALLDYVMVRPEYRKQYVAKKIWNCKLKEHNESKYYYLWVNMTRPNAIRFHESNCFHFDGLVDNIFKVN